MERDYYIYGLKDPRTDEIRYIGCTCVSLSQRFYHHKYNALKKLAQTHVAKWFRALNKEGFLPIIDLIEVCKKSNWEEREKYWISKYSNLTNIREGGAGIIVNRLKDGLQRSAEAHKKPIVLLDREGNFIKEFDSVKNCAKYLNVIPTAIGNALAGRAKTVKNHIVMEKEKYLKEGAPLYNGYISYIYQYDLEGNFIKKHDSITIAFLENRPCTYSSGLFEAMKHKKSIGGFFYSKLPITNFENFTISQSKKNK